MITLPCITLSPEWAFAIAHLGKDVENRTWPPPARLIGQRIGIHAGARKPTRHSLAVFLGTEAAARPQPPSAPDAWVSRDAGGALQVNFWRPTNRGSFELHSRPLVTRAVVATAVLGEARRDSPSPWAVPGELHWPLVDVRRLSEPVPVQKGRLGFFDIEMPAMALEGA